MSTSAPLDFSGYCKRKYKKMQDRVGPKKTSSGALRDPGRILPFAIEDLRNWLRTRAVREAIDAALVWECIFCHRMIGIEDLELDHANPLARGGGIDFDNLLCSCARCNRQKGELDAGEYVALLTFLRTTFQPQAEAYVLRTLGSAGLGQRILRQQQAQKRGAQSWKHQT